MQSVSIIFFGSSHHSLLVLERLYKHPACKIAGIVSQPDRPAGRKQISTPTPPSVFAQTHHIPLFRPASNPQKSWLYKKEAEQKLYSQIKKLSPDLLVAAYYGQLIPQKIVSLAGCGGLNLHPSLLPKYPGPAPGQWAILNGESQTGITILTLAKKFDQGKIVAQKKINIRNDDNYETLYARCFRAGAQLLIKILPKYLSGQIQPQKQTSPAPPAAYARKLGREDGRINWINSPAQIERQIRAFSPWPGAWTTLAELTKNTTAPQKRVKILKAHLDTDGSLKIDEVQVEGKKPVGWEQFKSSYL